MSACKSLLLYIAFNNEMSRPGCIFCILHYVIVHQFLHYLYLVYNGFSHVNFQENVARILSICNAALHSIERKKLISKKTLFLLKDLELLIFCESGANEVRENCNQTHPKSRLKLLMFDLVTKTMNHLCY